MAEKEITFGGSNLNGRTLILPDGVKHELTKKQARLLQCMATFPNQNLKRSELLNIVWKEDTYFAGRSMDVFVAKLRQFLKADTQIEIITVRRYGFYFEITPIKKEEEINI